MRLIFLEAEDQKPKNYNLLPAAEMRSKSCEKCPKSSMHVSSVKRNKINE